MAESRSLNQLRHWHALLRAEHNRRRQDDPNDDAREQLLAKLEEMGQRLRADPNFVEPTPAEKAQSARELERWFRERGYGRN